MSAEATTGKIRGRPPWLEAVGGQVLALLGAFLVAGVVGGIIIWIHGENPVDVYLTVWRFSTARVSDFARVLAIATPLIFSGLAVSVAFKAGLFNIGVEGQYIIGMVTASTAALFLDFLPGPLLLPTVVLAAMAGSLAWASLPAVLKVRTGAHEVVTTIMMNGIAISLAAWALLQLQTAQAVVGLQTDRFPEGALVPDIGTSLGLIEQIPPSSHLTWLFPLAILSCAAVWFLLFRTRLGYEVRAVGSSAGAAEAGGVSIGGVQIKIFLISGALAGFVGLNHLLGDRGFLAANYEAGLGFAGITVAFLGRTHPVGVALAGILLGMLARGQDGIALEFELPTEILIILQGVLILSVVVAYELVNRALVRRRQRQVRAEELGTEASANAAA